MYDRKIYYQFREIMKEEFKLRLKKKKDYSRFKFVFDYSFNSLSLEFQEIIKKTYLDSKFKFWWMELYPQTTFYRKRHRAISSFVHLFNLIYENFNDFTFNSHYVLC